MIRDRRVIHEELRMLSFDCEHKVDLWKIYKTREDIDDLENEMADWMKKNTKGRALINGDLLFEFEDPTDALLFKLRWV